MKRIKYLKLALFSIFLFLIFVTIPAWAAKVINQKVNFIAQAPLGEWSDSRQQDACEEAVVLMSVNWGRGMANLSLEKWRDEIVALSDFQQQKYGEYRDASLEDIVSRIFIDYFQYNKVEIKDVLESEDIVAEIEKGNLVLIPANGQLLNNPYFTPPGPERHMVLIKGYDYESEEFITNDPGTRQGADYRYSKEVLFKAIRPYKTGYHEAF